MIPGYVSGPIAPSNPYAITEYPGGADAGYNNTTGRVVVTPTINASTGIFITAGQSHIASVSSGATEYVPTNGNNVVNLNPYDGVYYKFRDPSLGCDPNANSGYSAGWMGRLGDNLINAGKYTTVVFVPVAIGGTYITDWAPYGVQFHRLVVAVLRCRSLGITPTAIMFQQGHADVHNVNPYFGGYTTTAQWQNAFFDIVRGLAGYGYNGKWMVANDIYPYTGDANATNIINAVNGVVGGNILAGPNLNGFTSSNLGPDNLHFSDAGNAACASAWATSIQAAL